jgi:hypothetical protein
MFTVEVFAKRRVSATQKLVALAGLKNKRQEKIMKKRNAGWLFGLGVIFGLSIALCLGAVEKQTAPAVDWSRLKVVGYPNGGTGFFDPDTGTIYVYDSTLDRCYLVRKMWNLGAPMRRP